MTSKIDQIGAKFRKLATRHDSEVARGADAPGAAANALGDEVEQLAWTIVNTPCDDHPGWQLKAAALVHYRGPGALVISDEDDITQALLKSLLIDLLRNSPDLSWLLTAPRA